MRYISIEHDLLEKVIQSLKANGDYRLGDELQQKLNDADVDQVSGIKL